MLHHSITPDIVSDTTEIERHAKVYPEFLNHARLDPKARASYLLVSGTDLNSILEGGTTTDQ